MNVRPVAASVLACAFLLMPQRSHAFDEIAGKERIGVQVGGLATSDGLNDAYGGGWNLTLFFTEKLATHFLLDVQVGALYLGELQFERLDDQLTNTPGIQGSMRMLYISIGPMVGQSLGGGYSMYASVGVGMYSVSMVFKNALTAYDFSDQHVGYNGGLGLARRLSGNWSVDANASVHSFPIDKNINDLYFAFTDGADAPVIFDVALGVTLDLR